MLSEEKKADSAKENIRRLKTPSQVRGLEEFYNEHKYPTESMKAELADRLGLTEKQVSGWFCHRRSKDKMSAKDEMTAARRQDLSSGVIQDHGSDTRQDSCGSNEQEHNVPLEYTREVLSQRLSIEDSPLVRLMMHEQTRECDAGGNDDETSSESSSDTEAEKDGYCFKRRDAADVDRSRNRIPNGSALLARKRKGPFGYLKIKGENPRKTAVKRQLGVQYRLDGPPLGVQFEPLPPGAFEFPMKHAASERYDGVEPILQRQPVDIAAESKQASLYNVPIVSSLHNDEELEMRRSRPLASQDDELCGKLTN